MEDVQNRTDDRGISINQVGVSGLQYPVTVLDRAKGKQDTVARFEMSVALPHHFKGTHMSRFVEILDANRGEITIHTLPAVLRELKQRLEADSARIEVRFPYFLERAAPATGATGLMDYECGFVAEANGGREDFTLLARVPVTSLCPCSKEISDYGAHNQRGYIAIEVRAMTSAPGGRELIWIEELIEIAEDSASAPLYPVLKRADERHVTMQAYDNPVFVEDMVRNVAVRLRSDPRVAWYRVSATNHESIHNHAVFAETSWQRP